MVDTVVLRYFLLVSRIDVLLHTPGRPIGVTRAVFDPESEAGPEETLSEIRRSIIVQTRRSIDLTRDPGARSLSAQNAGRLSAMADLCTCGAVVTLDVSSDERQLASRLTSAADACDFGLNAPLGMGEAACVAIAERRGHVLATDDADALRAFDVLAGQRRARIRSLLRDAIESRLLTQTEAGRLHSEMRRLGFWDHPWP